MKIENRIYSFEEVKQSFLTYISNKDDIDRIEKAYKFAEKKHAGQKRKSGDPYITHLTGVAMILTTLQTGPSTLIAGLLHDTIEDTNTTPEEITSEFGQEVCTLVESLTKLTRLSDFHNVDFEAEDHRKIFIAMAKDIRVIIIKLADRLHNMRTLQFQPPEKQRKIAKETMEVYAPIAHRLGISKIKTELEDLSLYYLEPEKFAQIEKLLDTQADNREKAIIALQQKLIETLNPTNIKFEISSRVKSIYSIYKKMFNKGKPFDEIYDILALRIITETEVNCYEILGYIHAMFKPVPGRFKDYIAMPKPNMYQSLHTTIVTGDGHIFEIQIRTHEMDEVAESGIAAHWRYKEGLHYDAKQEQAEIEEQLHWLRDFVSISNESTDSTAREYVDFIQHDIFDANVYVFTPKGKVISLPAGSTPIDFAYRIHTNIGDSVSGAKVNNQLVPLSTKLKTGDVVEIKTSKTATPNQEWLNFVQTSFAKSRIRKFIMKQNADFVKEEQIEKGRQTLIDAFKEKKIKANVDKVIDRKVLDKFNVEDFDSFYLGIYNRTIVPAAVIEFLELDKNQLDLEQAIQKQVNKRVVKQSPHDSVLLADGDTAMITLANCCTPIPGDKIVGYITKGNGIKVHRCNCPNIINEPNRLVDVIWNPNMTLSDHPVDLAIDCYDRPNLLMDIFNMFSQQKTQVYKVNAKSHQETSTATITVTVMASDITRLNALITEIKKVPSVFDVRRVIH